MKKFYSIIPFNTKSIDDKEYTLEGVFSTSDEDRHGDVVEQDWELERYFTNPVILNSHQQFDATETIGKMEALTVKNGKLEGKIKFAVNENPKAKIIFDLYAGGFLNAFSAGFIPKAFSNDGKIMKSELLEVSAVAVPANAMALAKSAGIDVAPLFKGESKKADDITDFPEKGGNKKISLKNSQYRQFDYQFAKNIKDNYPDIWRKGGNIRGNEAFGLWEKARSGDDSTSVINWIKEREAWMARHKDNKNIEGVVAIMKWGGVGSRGISYMKKLMNEQKEKSVEIVKTPTRSKIKLVNNIIKDIGEINKVETCSKNSRANTKNKINRVIRNLIKLKNNI